MRRWATSPALGDQWSGYIPADQYKYQMNTEGKGCGIGVSVVTSGAGLPHQPGI